MDWSFFAFPLNLLLALLWIVCWRWMWKNRPQWRVVRFFMSPAATVSAIGLLIAACLWIGFSGEHGFVESVVFVLVLLYVQTVLLMVTLRGWRRPDGVIRWRFLLLHAGLLLAVGSGFWGAPDSSESRLAMVPYEEADRAVKRDGSVVGLGYELQLIELNVETDDAGVPSHYEARVSVDGAEPVSITVNDPYSVGFGEDIYLVSVNKNNNYCILQIVREPWRYFALAGIVMLIAGAFMLFIKGPRR
jgi:hypothetical protein